MPLLWSYAKPPPDKEAGPAPRRFIRHSVETKKAVPRLLAWDGPYFTRRNAKCL